MAERIPLRNESRRAAQENDPFAELAQIIGFDPRVRVRGSASPASSLAAGHDDGPAAAEPADRSSAPPAPAGFSSKAETESGEVGEWEQAFSDFAVWDTEEAGAVAAPGDETAAKGPAGLSSAETEDTRAQQAALRPEPGRSAPEAERDDASAARQGSSTETPIETRTFGERPRNAPAGDEGQEQSPTLPGTARRTEPEHPSEPPDTGTDIDLQLDDVLAASIERDLEGAWLGDDPPAPDEEAASVPAAVHADFPAEPTQDLSESPRPIPARQEVSAPAASAALESPRPDFESELVAYLGATNAESSPQPRAGLSRSAQADDAAAAAGGDEKELPNPSPAVSRPVASDAGNATSLSRRPAQAVEDALRPFAGKEFATEGPAAAGSVADSRRKPAEAVPAVPAPKADDDPFAALAAMAARYRAAQFNPTPAPKPSKATAPVAPPAPQPLIEQEAEVEDMKRYPFARSQAPEIETVEVTEYGVALTDDVDVPDTPFDEPPAPRDRFGNVDAEFADLLEEMGGEPSPKHERAYAQRQASAYRDLPDARYETAPRAAYRSDYAPRDYSPEPAAVEAPAYGHHHAAEADGWPAGDYAGQYSEAYDETVYPEAFAEDEEPAPYKQPRKRGRWLAALFGSVAIFGAAGAFALKYTGAADLGGPLLVKADATPIKIRPENPGGVAVPNQENQVYERVAGLGNVVPTQPKLISNDEQPVSLDEESDDGGLPGLDLSSEDEDAPAMKGDDRVSAAEEEPLQPAKDPIMVTPRKVRTVVVKADGTMVAQEPATPAVQSLVAEASSAIDTVKKGSVAAAIDAANPTASVKPDENGKGSASPISAQGDDLPTAQPAVIEASAMPAAWSMQIASQPSEGSARSSYADLAKRYSAVLAGRDVSIVRAEVSGKGTFWRVRVAADTRSDAVSLCQSYKAAGGTCFVSK